MPVDDRRSRPSVPSTVKRQLRQEAGFGCCICGSPILDYHHIIEWSDDPHFRPEDMMVLCPQHHDQATKGALPVNEQYAAKRKPYNIERGLAGGLLKVVQSYAAVELGSITMIGEGSFIRAHDRQILGLRVQDGSLLVSLTLYSETGELLCDIHDNEWISGDPLAWDIEASWQTLVVRERKGSINLAFDAKSIPMKLTGTFWHQGVRIHIKQGVVFINQREMHFGLSNLAFVGTTFKIDDDKLAMDPNGEGVIISWPDKRERLWKAVAAWNKIKSKRQSNS